MSSPEKTIKEVQAEIFSDGEQAFDDGLILDDCPYEADSTFGVIWVQGWRRAEFIAFSEAERNNADRDLDDPRHGQAAAINREWK